MGSCYPVKTSTYMQAAMVVVLPVVLLLLLGSSPTGRAADGEHEEFTVLDMSSLKPHAACTGHRVTPPHNGSWVALYHPLGPCSPSSAAARAKKPSLAELLRQDRLRVRHIHRKASGGHLGESKGSRKDPVTVQETQIHHQAAITVGVGSQSQSMGSQMRGSDRPAAADDGTSGGGPAAVSQTVVLDTGSDVPWVDCVPCALAQCPYYDPARSSTYAAFPCNSTACKQLGPHYANGCVNNQCQYRVVSTIDGSVTSSGTYSSDVLTINSGNAVTSFRFGCNTNTQQDSGGPTSGVMALGRGPQSLTAQTSSTYGDAFSYCLPQLDSDRGFFRIGVPTGAAYRFAMTPLLRDTPGSAVGPTTTVYRVRMVAVTVNGQPLNVAAEAFAAGAVVDSVTVFTRLPLTVYGALRAAFRDRMAGYRRAPPRDGFDTCYDLAGVRSVKLPRIALVFDGKGAAAAAVEIDRSGILLENGCLAFAANDDDSEPAVFGNTQQKTIEVLHDVGGGNMGFRRLAC